MAAGGAKLAGAFPAAIRAAWAPTVIGMLLIYAGGLHYLVLGLPGAGYGKHLELVPVGWRELTRQITDIGRRADGALGGKPLIVGLDRYAIASEVAFYGAEARSVTETSSANLFDGLGLMYGQWTPAARQNGRTLLLVGWDPRDLTGGGIESRADRLGPVESGELMRDGRLIRRYYYRLVYNYSAVPRVE
jgi:dolichol-phosphate mannosyltransferase